MSLLSRVLLLCTVLAGCGDVDRDEAAKACRDTLDAFAGAAERCSMDAELYRRNFLQSVANGDCENIVDIRDLDALYDDCIPSAGSISCEDLLAGAYDSSCDEQLVRDF